MRGLFDGSNEDRDLPLAEIHRPTDLRDVFGQDHAISEGSPLSSMLLSGRPRSMILWGPTGSGKTTIARIVAGLLARRTRTLQGGSLSAADLRSAFSEAEMLRSSGSRTCLIVEEIHRMSRALQEQLLAPMESGLIVLIGNTTEHVAYDIVDPLLSRAQVVKLRQLDENAIERTIERFEERSSRRLPLTSDGRRALVHSAGGDARRLMGNIETLLDASCERDMGPTDLARLLGTTPWRSDKDRDLHYDRMSAMQKSIRASDPDAALFWFSQMIEAGEDMEFVMRRILMLSNEEIGLADPQALVHCQSACEAYRRLGPKAGLPILAQAILHLACAPKSDSTIRAYRAARSIVRTTGDVDPNTVSINHPTREVARARGYVDDHSVDGAFAGQDHWPNGLPRRTLYAPTPRGSEAATGRRLEHWNSLRARTPSDTAPSKRPETSETN